MILSRSHKYQPTSFIIEPGLLLIMLLGLLLTHSVTDYELGPYPRVRLLIDLINNLQRLAHCTHTTEPMASHSHSGGPMAFRQNPSIAMTLSRPLRPNPNGLVLGGPVSTKETTTTVVVERSHTGTRYQNLNNGHTRLCLLTGPG